MKSRAMITALTVSYADRLAAFGLPFLMLRLGGGPEVFVHIEYVISVSVIVSTFADVGLSSYVLYYFGRSRDANRTTLLTSRAMLVMLFAQIGLFAGALALSHFAIHSGIAHTYLPLGVLRGIALAILSVATQIFIIHDKPLTGIALSLCSWLIGGAALLLPNTAPIALRIIVFFSATFVITLAVPLLLWSTKTLRLSREGLNFTVSSLKWGWPILVATASTIAVAQVARIYGLATFDTRVATAFAFWMRIFAVVQLSHRAAIMMVSRRIFVSDDNELSSEVLLIYFKMLLPAIALAFGAVLAAPWLNRSFDLHIPILGLEITGMIGAQVTLWCFTALTELYFSRENSVRYIMVASALPALGFTMFLVFVKISDLMTLASAMAAASLAQFLFLLLFRRLRLNAARRASFE